MNKFFDIAHYLIGDYSEIIEIKENGNTVNVFIHSGIYIPSTSTSKSKFVVTHRDNAPAVFDNSLEGKRSFDDSLFMEHPFHRFFFGDVI